MQPRQAVALEHDLASPRFCFGKIAWQFALDTPDGCCFLEGIL
jgi:hypothetical protein